MGSLEDDRAFGEEQRVDKVLLMLFFLVFAVLGYAFFRFFLF